MSHVGGVRIGKQAEGNGARRRQRRSFTPEFKAEVVALVRRGERSVPAICRELDLSETAVRRWVAQAAVDAGEPLSPAELCTMTASRVPIAVYFDTNSLRSRSGSYEMLTNQDLLKLREIAIELECPLCIPEVVSKAGQFTLGRRAARHREHAFRLAKPAPDWTTPQP